MIRTRGGLTHSKVRAWCLKPLGQPSKSVVSQYGIRLISAKSNHSLGIYVDQILVRRWVQQHHCRRTLDDWFPEILSPSRSDLTLIGSQSFERLDVFSSSGAAHFVHLPRLKLVSLVRDRDLYFPHGRGRPLRSERGH